MRYTARTCEPRKVLTTTGNIQINDDTDGIYMRRIDGGQGIRSVRTTSQGRVVSRRQYLSKSNQRNEYILCVLKSENKNISCSGEDTAVSCGPIEAGLVYQTTTTKKRQKLRGDIIDKDGSMDPYAVRARRQHRQEK